MAIIVLHGWLGEKYQKRIKVVFPTGQKIMQALLSQFGGFQKDLSENNFRIRIAGKDIKSAEEIEQCRSIAGPIGLNEVMHIIPVEQGAGGGGGVFMVIAGVVAIAAAFFTGGASLAAWGALQAGLAVAGAMMIIGGVAAMMVKTPKATAAKTSQASNNTGFSSVDNMMGQGNPIPLCYGENKIGSMVASQQIETF